MLMSGYDRDMVKAFLKTGKLAPISEYAAIRHASRKKNLIVSSYTGSDIRMYTKGDTVHLMYPEEVQEIQLESVADAIAKGTIFDDAEEVDRHAHYLTMTNTPTRAMAHHGIDEPKHLKIVVSGIIGKMSPDGTLEISLADMRNGQQFLDQLKTCDVSGNCHDAEDLVDHYVGAEKHTDLPKDFRDDIYHMKSDVKDIGDLDMDDEVDDRDPDAFENDDDDYEEIEEAAIQEGFFAKRPKKLKPIPRDVVAYITVEMNAIQDSNDQAMLAGYTCSKLELVDFYITCIDTKDDRYIVPHTREYLVAMQNDLERLLQQILRIKPIQRGSAIWKPNVTLPEGWRG